MIIIFEVLIMAFIKFALLKRALPNHQYSMMLLRKSIVEQEEIVIV